MTVLRIILAIFSTYRLALILTQEEGPLGVFARWRAMLGRIASKEKAGGFWYSYAELFHCPHCLGVWVAVLFGLLALSQTLIGDIILMVLGIAGAQSFLTRLTENSNETE